MTNQSSLEKITFGVLLVAGTLCLPIRSAAQSLPVMPGETTNHKLFGHLGIIKHAYEDIRNIQGLHITVTRRQIPVPIGFHIPHREDFQTEKSEFSNTLNEFRKNNLWSREKSFSADQPGFVGPRTSQFLPSVNRPFINSSYSAGIHSDVAPAQKYGSGRAPARASVEKVVITPRSVLSLAK